VKWSFVGVDNVLVGEGIIEWYGKYLKGNSLK
jgi:ABC-type sugar transport system substrate-binding protein